jgi:hypothetical protein
MGLEDLMCLVGSGYYSVAAFCGSVTEVITDYIPVALATL